MDAEITNAPHSMKRDTDADIDFFLADHHGEVAADLAAGREQIARGEAVPLEPLEALLRDARARR
jgi:hypothetical protein